MKLHDRMCVETALHRHDVTVVERNGRIAAVWFEDKRWHARLVERVEPDGRVWWIGSETIAPTKTEALERLEY